MDAGCDHASAFALVVEGHGIVGGMWGTPTLMRGCWQSARYRWPVEQLDDEDLHTEEILPTVRVHHCGPLGRLGAAEQQRAAVVVAVADGLLISNGGRLALTDRARLLADALVRTLLG